ncbi:energy-coupling factor transporter transmembrane component T family protein [Mycoplasmopsis opalescens]|uniref:energy-coupling factor transporter transmembrane component T family protein n=1 Tax=Mycoplasmopsis opalescens TaxID=114886 RepID=UPI0004A704B5|nr:energy-coupling factor transporter transmembrane component T [Mycoplasmopsis opalescens]
MKSSPIGSYLNRDSFIHRLDPRIKLILNIVIIVLTFISTNFTDLAILLLISSIGYLITTRKFSSLINLMKFPVIVSIFILFVNIYTMKNPDANNYIPIFYITPESKVYAFSYGVIARTLSLFLRIYIMIISTSLFVISTRPVDLTKAFEDLLWPLKLIFIPTSVIATIISIALRFIPTLLDEANRIIKAQASRGVDFKNGNIKEKIKAFTTLIIPLFAISFAKAEDLANAMETRGYNPKAKRTKYRKLITSWRDVLMFALILIVLEHILFLKYGIYPIENLLPEWWTKYIVFIQY